ncbi:MAG TPA: hypothetical protein VHB68_04015 [Steroidobacteraceae bacterium]|nr:hypothetical protein [Steroidobacteraceae bacterium]
MTTLTAENRESVARLGSGITPLWELGLRLVGAALHIMATVAVVQVLQPIVAGVYFRGVIIAFGLAALLRGKYDLFIFEHFIDPQQSDLGTAHARVVVRALGIRVLVRSAIACAVLLVITTDLDVMDVYLRPYLQTYLPFVLAVPFATLALFLASTLRATNHVAGSVIVSTYSTNVLIIAGSFAIPMLPESALEVLSWSFFTGNLLAAGMGVLLTRHVFKTPADPGWPKLSPAEWRDIFTSTARNGLTGVALAAVQWGPTVILGVLGTSVEIAQYAVVTRTAQIIDFIVPGAIFVPQSARIQSRLCRAMRTARGKLAVDLSVSLATTSLCVVAVAILTPWFVGWYGPAYAGLTLMFLLLFLMQWVNGAARPAVRRLAADWDLRRVRRALVTSMGVAIVLSTLGIGRYGAVAAAVGMLAGAVVLNAQAILAALKQVRTGTPP